MLFRRVMTGLVAAVVCVFSVSMFGVMWKINEKAQAMRFSAVSDTLVWEGRYHNAEIEMKNGAIERFVFYRKTCDCENT